MQLRAELHTTDAARSARLLIAWLTADQDGFDTQLEDARVEPTGVNGLLRGLLNIAGQVLAVGPNAHHAALVRMAALDLEESAERVLFLYPPAAVAAG